MHTLWQGSWPAASARAQRVWAFAAPTAAAAPSTKLQRFRSESSSTTWALAHWPALNALVEQGRGAVLGQA